MTNYMLVLKKFADFSGRSRRRELWMFNLTAFILNVVLIVFGYIVGVNDLFMLLHSLFLFVPSLAVAVRRLHDTNRSGWWLLVTLIPVVGLVLLYFLVIDGDAGDNQYGSNPKGVTA
ncbi:DUF805 domain-containing protein [Photobacterium sp. GJ3]|uniref:DUF805 domain-containing protein n=1 Tax=Photobacterium sp. GJ3 TaxID=2829502 RepID=UPI001B8AFB43|nr:DUF805 domain-containing protein [Photobacterium sp. GJ3]QUJ68651.1 DUF805 domain-containing protein [Photobacterium sp. GJ3]